MPQETRYHEQRTFFRRFAALYMPWFALTTLLAALPLSPYGMARFVICTVTILAPVAAFVLAYRRRPDLRSTVLRLDLTILHLFQIARLAGIGMLVGYAVDRLAPPFALWAGGIDVFIGLSATFVAFLGMTRDPLPRRALMAWNALGLLDFAVAFGIWFLWSPTLMGVLADHSTTALMLRLPLSFIPMAGVPIAAIVHIIALLQLHRGDHDAPNKVLHDHTPANIKIAS